MTLQIILFQPELVPEAAHLLARRHRRDRTSLPQLPARFEAPEQAAQAITAVLQRPRAGGFAAVSRGQLVGYLIGDMVIDNLWGRSGWVRGAGCAYDPAVGVEVIRDLYAALGAGWLAYGIFCHFVLIPAADPTLSQAWFSLSFGLEQIHAVLDLQPFDPPPPPAPGLEIRQAGPADRHHLVELSDLIWQTQVQAPVWGVMMPESVAETATGWAELVDEAGVTVWLAWQGGKPLAVQGYWPAESGPDTLNIPEKCVHLSVAGTREAARGRGLATRLTQHGLAQAGAAGYRYCEADWRSTNLLASRFWPKQGFQPVQYRLVRRLDPRITWAKGTVPA
jgi:GNAT superfamily N-acetyltransferase